MKNSLAISLLMDLYQKEVILGTEETLNNLLQYLSAKTFLNDRILESFYLLKYFSFTKLENTCKNWLGKEIKTQNSKLNKITKEKTKIYENPSMTWSSSGKAKCCNKITDNKTEGNKRSWIRKSILRKTDLGSSSKDKITIQK